MEQSDGRGHLDIYSVLPDLHSVLRRHGFRIVSADTIESEGSDRIALAIEVEPERAESDEERKTGGATFQRWSEKRVRVTYWDQETLTGI